VEYTRGFRAVWGSLDALQSFPREKYLANLGRADRPGETRGWNIKAWMQIVGSMGLRINTVATEQSRQAGRSSTDLL